MAILAITFKCNSKCKTCNVWEYHAKNKGKIKEEMDFNEFKTFIDNNLQLEDISLTGGEIFLKDELVNMWLYMDKKGFRTGGPCNAVNMEITKRKTTELLTNLSGKNKHLIQFSIDGIGEEHDRIRGIPGNFDNALELLKWAMDKKKKHKFIELSISHNITRTNYKNLPQFIDYFVNLGIKPSQISFRPVQISESRYENLESGEVFRDISEYKEVIKVIRQIQDKYPVYKQNLFINNLIKYLRNPTKLIAPCYAGYNFVYINPFWEVFPCSYFDSKLGNLRENNFTLKKIVATKEFKKVGRNIKKGNCPKCWTTCFGIRSMLSDPIQLPIFCYHNLYRLLK
jgi:MoaA/NifB/PqqE/SkfB family radical SAM enzyme